MIVMVKVASASNVDHALLHELLERERYIQAYKKLKMNRDLVSSKALLPPVLVDNLVCAWLNEAETYLLLLLATCYLKFESKNLLEILSNGKQSIVGDSLKSVLLILLFDSVSSKLRQIFQKLRLQFTSSKA